ncbi:hypothetical protein [Microcoleus vaginatus]
MAQTFCYQASYTQRSIAPYPLKKACEAQLSPREPLAQESKTPPLKLS